MTYTDSAETIEALAADIGDTIYMDIAKWHLYLREAKLHTLLAEQLYALLTAGTLSENNLIEVLQAIPIKLGGGRRTVPLIDLLPLQSQVHLMDLLEEYQGRL